MNSRQRFHAVMDFKETDRPFRWETPGTWAATSQRWATEGYDKPANISLTQFFEMDDLRWIPIKGGWTGNPYYPMFEIQELSVEDENRILIDRYGITKKERIKNPETSMPQFLKFPVENRQDYEDKIRPRFDYRSPERLPENWSELVKQYNNRDYTLGLHVIGPFGFLRNLMGDENLMYAFFDDPKLVHEMMYDWKVFYIGFLKSICADMVPDFTMIWEDISYSRGPLISPELFEEFMSGPLTEVIDCMREMKIKGIIVDTDGDCHKMLPIYLNCGANAFYPFEVQAGMDIVQLRKQYGQSFVIIGGLNKRALAGSKEDIIEEVDSKYPFMISKKGWIPMLDHTVPPDVPYENFKFFLEYVRSFEPKTSK